MTEIQVGPELRFRRNPNGAIGSYRVLLDGRDIGEVRKWERRYNLRRVIVARGWQAFDADGKKVARPYTQAGAWDTRLEAGTQLALREMQNHDKED